jgi:hypothetical protein
MKRIKARKWLQALIFFGVCAAVWIGISHACARIEDSTPPYGEPDTEELDVMDLDSDEPDDDDLDGEEL